MLDCKLIKGKMIHGWQKNIIQSSISAVTSISYGLIVALIVLGIVGAVAETGVNVKSVFSVVGVSASSSSMFMTPNPNLTSEQQSEITNSAAEIEAGTASLACLQNMNNNASTMASNGATCLGPGYGIAPPNSPVSAVALLVDDVAGGYWYYLSYQIAQSGLVYSISGNYLQNVTLNSVQDLLSSSGLAFYQDGYISRNSPSGWWGQDGGNSTCAGGTGDGYYSGAQFTPKMSDNNGQYTICTASAPVSFVATFPNVNGSSGKNYLTTNGQVVTW